MRQLKYIAERRTTRGVVRMTVWAISLVQAVGVAQQKTRELNLLGVQGTWRITSFLEPGGEEVRF